MRCASALTFAMFAVACGAEPASKPGVVLGEIAGFVDPAHGMFQLEPLSSAAGLLGPLNIKQNGTPDDGPSGSVELITTSLGFDGACGQANSYCGTVRVRSNYGVPVGNLFVQFTNITPSTGHLPRNADSQPGFSNTFGLWNYGNYAPDSSATRTWIFDNTNPTAWRFRARVFGDVDLSGTSCRDILNRFPGAPDGVYTIDLDGPGNTSSPRSMVCDMTNGGFTLIMNQVSTELLGTSLQPINEANFGRVDATYRLGGTELASIAPSVSWRMTDGNGNNVFFKPTCNVDLAVDYFTIPQPNDCTTGFTSEAFTSAVNGGWQFVSTRGIGINNFGQNCSIRLFESNADNPPLGSARACSFGTNITVQLWFR